MGQLRVLRIPHCESGSEAAHVVISKAPGLCLGATFLMC
jgi:hypothetical protein